MFLKNQEHWCLCAKYTFCTGHGLLSLLSLSFDMAAALVTLSLFWELNTNEMLGRGTSKFKVDFPQRPKKLSQTCQKNVHLTRHEATHRHTAYNEPSITQHSIPTFHRNHLQTSNNLCVTQK
jgi:hypothetical protein